LGGKEGLFAALYEEVQREVAAKILEAAENEGDSWSALRAGCHAFLDACTDPTVRRVVLLDAPAVLGWEHWREVDARHGLGLLKEGLQEAMEEGAIRDRPVDPVAHLLLGAMNEAAMWIARSGEPETALRQAGESLEDLLEGLHMPAS
jgi:AcrR family transcriptional regulator